MLTGKEAKNSRNIVLLRHRMRTQWHETTTQTKISSKTNLMPLHRCVKLSNITFPRTSKWSKSTCPTKIYLPENCHFCFLCFKENICCGYSLEAHQSHMLWYSLEAPQWGASNEYPQHMFSLKNKKNIYLKIWILSLARSMNYFSEDKLIKISCLSSGKWDKLDKSGMVFPQLCITLTVHGMCTPVVPNNI